MGKNNFFDLLKNAVDKVQKDNHDNPEEKTAPSNLFDRIRENLANSREKREETKDSGKGLFDVFREKLQEARKQNEEDPNEETAEPTVFEQLQAEIERLKEEKAIAEANQPEYGPQQAPEGYVEYGPDPEPTPTPRERPAPVDPIPSQRIDHIPPPKPDPIPAPSSKPRAIPPGMRSIISGGSIAVRTEPKMAAPQLPERIPAKTNLRVLEHTMDNAIKLDGKLTGWCLVEHGGMRGWVLDFYVS